MDILKNAIEESRQAIKEIIETTGGIRDLAKIKADEYEEEIIQKADVVLKKEPIGAVFSNKFIISYKIINEKTYEAKMGEFICTDSYSDLVTDRNGQFSILQDEMKERGFETKVGGEGRFFVFVLDSKSQNTKLGKVINECIEKQLDNARDQLLENMAKELKEFLMNNPSKIDSDVFYFTVGSFFGEGLEIPISAITTCKPTEPRSVYYSRTPSGDVMKKIILRLSDEFKLIQYGGNSIQIIEYNVRKNE